MGLCKLVRFTIRLEISNAEWSIGVCIRISSLHYSVCIANSFTDAELQKS